MPEKFISKYAHVTSNLTGLERLLADSNEGFVVRVGILGSLGRKKDERKEYGELKSRGGHKTTDEASDLTNADIGLAHEMGVASRNLPQRSWLRTPLEDHLPGHFEKLGDEVIKDILEKQDKKAYEELSVVCEQIIQMGFATGGYGKWAPLKLSTLEGKHKKFSYFTKEANDSILVDSGQLRKSITSAVVKV
jgi:hypothetical protein